MTKATKKPGKTKSKKTKKETIEKKPKEEKITVEDIRQALINKAKRPSTLPPVLYLGERAGRIVIRKDHELYKEIRSVHKKYVPVMVLPVKKKPVIAVPLFETDTFELCDTMEYGGEGAGIRSEIRNSLVIYLTPRLVDELWMIAKQYGVKLARFREYLKEEYRRIFARDTVPTGNILEYHIISAESGTRYIAFIPSNKVVIWISGSPRTETIEEYEKMVD